MAVAMVASIMEVLLFLVIQKESVFMLILELIRAGWQPGRHINPASIPPLSWNQVCLLPYGHTTY